MSSNYNKQSGGSKFGPIALISIVVGGVIFWLSKRSSQGSSSNGPGLKEQAKEMNEQIDKEELKTRFDRVFNLVKSTAASLQEIYDKQGKDLMEQGKQVKDQAENIASTAKEAGEELKDVRDSSGQEVKEELEGVKDVAKDAKPSSSSSSDDEKVPFNESVPPFRDPRNS